MVGFQIVDKLVTTSTGDYVDQLAQVRAGNFIPPEVIKVKKCWTFSCESHLKYMLTTIVVIDLVNESDENRLLSE